MIYLPRFQKRSRNMSHRIAKTTPSCGNKDIRIEAISLILFVDMSEYDASIDI